MAAAVRPKSRKGPGYLTAGPIVSAYFRTALRHTQGEWAGRKFVPTDWQEELLREAFLIDPRTGLRVYKTVIVGIGTKNGKSELAAGLGIYGLTQDGVDGVLEARPVVAAAAAARHQAGIVFDGACEMVQASPMLKRGLSVQKARIYNPANRGVFKAIASDANTGHGVNPSFIIVDEIHAFPNSKLLTTLQKSRAARRQAMTWIITHTGWNRYGVLGVMYDRMIKHPALELYGDKPGEPLLSVVRDRKNGVLFWWYGLREGFDAEDPEVWMKCNPSPWITKEFLMGQKGDVSLEWDEFVRFHLNGWIASKSSLLQEGQWAALGDPEMVIPKGAPVFIGIDAATKRDKAAIVITQPVVDEDGDVTYRMQAWVVDPKDEHDMGEKSMLRELENAVYRLAKRYDIREIAYDPLHFTRSADDLSEHFEMAEFPQSDTRMAIATRRFREHVALELIEHDNDEVFAAHVGDANTRDIQRGHGQRVCKTTTGKGRNIDACVAALLSLDRAINAVERGDVGPGQDIQIVPL